MKILIAYYSYSGNTKRIAEKLASEQSADIIEITDKKRPCKFKAFTVGVFHAIKGKAWSINQISKRLSDYEKLIIMSPVWANNPPPAVYSFLEILPEGKNIEVKMVSSSGNSGCKERVNALINARNCKLISYEDIKA